MIMLSATLDSPDKFAKWIENRPTSGEPEKKEVYLSMSTSRIVPLTHYCFVTTNQGLFKKIKKDEALVKEIKDVIDRPIMIKSATGIFQEETYHKIKKTLTILKQKEIEVNRRHVINNVCKYMFDNGMLPAVLFILSRKQIETISKEINTNLLEDDSKIPYIVAKECEEILRKLPNYEEYLQLPEYIHMVALLQKGIGMHHSGIIPILREITEILFSKGYIKLLLATETFSVGLNMPIKTTVFTSLSKYDGIENRYFHSHEYMQCSGRAGRRGIDKIGTVIHLNNLFRPIELQDYKTVMNGKAQTLVSKFKISYDLLLNLIGNGDNIYDFIERSMIQTSIEIELESLKNQIKEETLRIEKMDAVLKGMRTPQEKVKSYIDALENRKTAINKKRKEMDRLISSLKDDYKTIEQDAEYLISYETKMKNMNSLKREYDDTSKYLHRNIETVLSFLQDEGFLQKENESIILTRKGSVSSQLKEVNCLAFGTLISENELNKLDHRKMVELFSCFTNIVVAEDIKTLFYKGSCNILKEIINMINTNFDKYQKFETEYRIETGIEYSMHYDLVDYIGEWVDARNPEECKAVLQKIEAEKGIFLGEFVKAILKINTISAEMEKIAETSGNIELLSKLKEIPEKTLKFVATNQSLYL
jgi:hypothetical protein